MECDHGVWNHTFRCAVAFTYCRWTHQMTDLPSPSRQQLLPTARPSSLRRLQPSTAVLALACHFLYTEAKADPCMGREGKGSHDGGKQH
jgi:hypothetical protein